MSKSVKGKIVDNVLVAMMPYIEAETLHMLEQILMNELAKVQMQEITTLPIEYKGDVIEKNEYIIKLFLVKKKRLKAKTKKEYLNSIKRLITAIEYKSLDQMDENDIEWYLNVYERRNVASGGNINKPTTVNNEMRFLSAFFSWMRKAKLISENPVECVEPMKVILKQIDYYSDEEIARLRDACKNIRERAILEVFRSTGARVGEIADITLDQVNLDTGDIVIIGEKGGRARTIFLDSVSRYYYKMYLATRTDPNPAMFVHSCAPYEQMSTCGFRGIFKIIKRQAGLQIRVYPHKFRKTLGMNLLNKGVGMDVIKEIMGHQSMAVTSTYYAQATLETVRYEKLKVA